MSPAPTHLTECDSAESEFVVNITFDSYPQETSWVLRDNCLGNVVESGGNYDKPDSSFMLNKCIPSSSYTFIILDSFGDGIGGEFGQGYYSVSYEGKLRGEGAQFGFLESVNFGKCSGGIALKTTLCENNMIPVELDIIFDAYSHETSWTLINDCTNKIVDFGSGYVDKSDPFNVTVCVPPAKYSFTILDSHGDGMCCKYGDGSYKVSYDGYEVAVGGEFNSTENVSFGGCVNADF